MKTVLGMLLLGIFALVAMGSDGCDTTTEDPTVKKGDGANDVAGDAETATVGDTLSLKGTAYTVNSVETTSTVGSGFTKTEANGEFIVIDLTLKNEEDEPATILEDNLKLIGGNGSQYSTSTDASLAVNDAFVLLEEIQPGLKQQGKLIYDVPRSAVSGSVLQVEDLFSDSTGQIDLGL